MNIEDSFMTKHVFVEKKNNQYGGGMSDSINMDKIITGAIPLSKLCSNKNIKSISHLGVPCGLIQLKKPMNGGGNNMSIKLKNQDNHIVPFDNSLATKLFDLHSVAP